ncbi:MAG: hypothetical protein GY950_33870 [bacterium]|nr:hypothetical protein [bacterium]
MKNLINKFVFGIFFFLLTFIVMGMFCRKGLVGYAKCDLPHMVDSTAHKPFVYRALTPMVVRAVVSLIPARTVDAVNRAASGFIAGLPGDMRERLDQLILKGLDQRYYTQYLVAVVVLYLTLLGFLAALRRLAAALYNGPPMFFNWVMMGALVCLPGFFIHFCQVYDFSTLLLFTMGLGLMVQKKWPAYLFVFLLSCLNKETTILLLLIYGIYFWRFWRNGRMTRSQYFLLGAGQVFIFLVVRFTLLVIFAGNPGVSFEIHFSNFVQLPYNLPFAFFWLGLAGLVYYDWKNKPQFLKDGLWIVVPLVLPAAFMGFIYELRAFYEVYPIVLLLIAHAAAKLLGVTITPAAKEETAA